MKRSDNPLADVSADSKANGRRTATSISTSPPALTGKVVHTSEMISQGGRDGTVEAPNNKLRLQLEKNGESPVTPEMLFAGAYASCYHGALLNAATRAHLMVPGSTVIARVTLHESEQGSYYLSVELRASLPGIDRSQAERLMHQAHKTCPYSQATRGNIDVFLVLD
ncbi:MAG: Ohr family peroxiredoxin [Nibricoccus sp.]